MKNNINKPVKASIAYIIASALQQGIGFITVPIFTRLLSTSDYGIINIFNAWYGILQIIVTLAPWGGMFNNGMIEFKDDRNGFTSSLMQLSVTNSIICGGVFLLFAGPVSALMGLSECLLYIMAMRFASDAVMNLWLAQQRYEYNYVKVLIVSVLTAVLNPILALFAIFIVPGNKGNLKIIFSSIPVLIAAIIIFYLYKKQDEHIVNVTYWKYAVYLNVPLVPHFLSGALLSQSDRIMIAHFCGESYVGIYGVAYSLASILSVILIAINGALVPFVYRCLESKEYKSIKKLIDLILAVVTLACTGIMLLAPEAIHILAPESYYEAVYVIPPVAAGVFFTFLYGIFVNVEYFYKQNKKVMYATIVAAVLNIALNAIFIPRFGFIAAAYTTLAGYLALSILHYIFAKKILSPLPYNMLAILASSAFIMVMMVVAALLYTVVFVRYAIIALLVALWLVIVWKSHLHKMLFEK